MSGTSTSGPSYHAAAVLRGGDATAAGSNTSSGATATTHALSSSSSLLMQGATRSIAAVPPQQPFPSNNYFTTVGSTAAHRTSSGPPHNKRPHFTTTGTTSSSNDSYHHSSFPSGSITSTGSTPTAKRPYRRTKRPKDYNDRSTITATTLLPTTSIHPTTAPTPGEKSATGDSSDNHATATANTTSTSSNPYDAILDESNDLLQAAHEAQQLGRYSMASAYLLLLHARLVGLGRRFDKSLLLHGRPPQSPEQQPQTQEEPPAMDAGHETDAASRQPHEQQAQDVTKATTPGMTRTRGMEENAERDAQLQASCPPQRRSDQTPGSRAENGVAHGMKPDSQPPPPPVATDPLTPKTRATKEFLSQLIPRDIEWDRAMMEHLARAAVELHAARSGHKKPVHYQSPEAVRHFWATTANQLGVTTAATQLQQQRNNHQGNPKTNSSTNLDAAERKKSAADSMKASKATAITATTTSASDKGAGGGGGIAWTDEEIQVLNRAVAQGKRDPVQLVGLLPGRTEQQIKLYLKNQTERQRVHHETMQELSSSTTSAAPTSTAPSVAVPSSSALTGTAPAASSGITMSLGGGVWPGSSSRGRKPATAAMNTVPNAVCDARALLSQAQEQQRQRDQS